MSCSGPIRRVAELESLGGTTLVTICTTNHQTKMKKFTHVLITLTFAFACLSLWAILTTLGKVVANSPHTLPGFTRMCMGLSPLLLMLPIPVVGYCLYMLFRRQPTEQSSTTFLACTMSVLCLVFFPVLVALFLPCLRFMER